MNINNKIATNLVKFMQENAISANNIAKAGGVTTSTITRFLAREIKSLNIETIKNIADYYNISLEKFIDGSNSFSSNAEFVKNQNISFISFYKDIDVSAGSGIEYENDGIVSSLPIPTYFLNLHGVAPEDALIVKVSGDSMSPTLNNEDLVIVNKNFSSSLNGIYVIKDDINGLRVKRLDKDKDGSLKVISDNKKYETQLYSADELKNEIIVVIGKVSAKIASV